MQDKANMSYKRITVTAMLYCGTVHVACADREDEIRREPQDDVMRAPAVTIVALAEDPARYDGQSVRLVGEVERRIGGRVFVVRGRGALWSAKVPIIERTSAAIDVIPPGIDDTVEVRGIVRHTLPPDVARELGTVAVDEMGAGPYVVAGAIRRDD